MPTGEPNSSSSVPAPSPLLPRPFPELGEALHRCVEVVCQVWLKRMRAAVTRLAEMDDEQALDDLPDVIRAVADALAGAPGSEQVLTMIGGTHGLTRFHQGFSAGQLLKECPVLRQVMHQELRRELNRNLTPEEVDVQGILVDHILALSTAAFTTLQEKEIRLENEATGRHLAMMSHDLRNSLNAAMLSMQMVRERVGDLLPSDAAEMPELLADMDDCRRMAMSAVDSMTRVLEAERLRVGRVPLAMQKVDVCGLLRSVSLASSRAVGERASPDSGHSAHGRITIDCPSGLAIQSDPDLLSTILQNLVGNAVRHAGDAAIRLAAKLTADGLRIEVNDAGPGIPPERLQEIVTLFNPAVAPPAVFVGRSPGESGGSGLGLFICRRAADLLAARLEVASTGDGARFAVVLPTRNGP